MNQTQLIRTTIFVALLCATVGGSYPAQVADASAKCTRAPVNAMDYCASNRCGPCVDGAGDCDPGQCAAGLECVEEGAVDHCRPLGGCTPGAMDFCWSSQCGPCSEGEGDCDPGQCEAGLDCVEEGAVDHCRTATSGSNLQVQVGGTWQGVCCAGSRLEISSADCTWTEQGRVLTDETAGRKLDCPEGGPTGCTCDSTGERMHGDHGGDLGSIEYGASSPLYSDYGMATCIVVTGGALATAWTSGSCPEFRLE